MSKRVATAFQTANKALALDTRVKTLGVYRSLLRSCQPFAQATTIKRVITEKFKANRHDTSRPQVLQLLEEANKTLDYFTQASSGNHNVAEKIDTYVRRFYPQKKAELTKKIPSERASKALTTTTLRPPQPSGRKKSKFTKRKPYQVAILTRTSSGFLFRRVRGWKQPVRTAMMLKNKRKRLQRNLDRFNMLQEYLQMIIAEKVFLSNLGCLPQDKLYGYEVTIKAGMAHYFRYKLKWKTQLPDDE